MLAIRWYQRYGLEKTSKENDFRNLENDEVRVRQTVDEMFRGRGSRFLRSFQPQNRQSVSAGFQGSVFRGKNYWKMVHFLSLATLLALELVKFPRNKKCYTYKKYFSFPKCYLPRVILKRNSMGTCRFWTSAQGTIQFESTRGHRSMRSWTSWCSCLW